MVLVTFLQACVASSVKMVLPPRSVMVISEGKHTSLGEVESPWLKLTRAR